MQYFCHVGALSSDCRLYDLTAKDSNLNLMQVNVPTPNHFVLYGLVKKISTPVKCLFCSLATSIISLLPNSYKNNCTKKQTRARWEEHYIFLYDDAFNHNTIQQRLAHSSQLDGGLIRCIVIEEYVMLFPPGPSMLFVQLFLQELGSREMMEVAREQKKHLTGVEIFLRNI